jgi:hypothetical protein
MDLVDKVSAIEGDIKSTKEQQQQMQLQMRQQTSPSQSTPPTKRRKKATKATHTEAAFSPPSDTAKAKAKRGKKAPSYTLVNTQESSEDQGDSSSSDSSDDDSPPPKSRRGKALKSGRVTTADHVVTKRVKWPHYVVDGPTGIPLKYDDLTLEQLVLGHMKVAMKAKPKVKAIMEAHLLEMMRDISKYGFTVVKDFHSTWLMRLEARRATWEDTDARRELREAQVTSHPRIDRPKATVTAAASKYAAATTSQSSYKQFKQDSPKKADPGTKACLAWQEGTCRLEDGHDKKRHVCVFCLRLMRHLNPHQARHCRKKEFAAKQLSGGWEAKN